MSEKIAVIGAGINGVFAAYYLAYSGYDVTVFDRGDIDSGTSGRFHGMLHSGARYATNDAVSAGECITENRRISGMASRYVEDTGGFFLAANDDESDFGDKLYDACRKVGIDITEVPIEEFIRENPQLSMARRAMRVPDKVIRSYEFVVSVAASAHLLGADIKTFSEVKKIDLSDGSVAGLEYERHGKIYKEKFDVVVNATGPFSGKILERSGLRQTPVMPSAGVMVVLEGRVSTSIINRMREPSDADILLPYWNNSILGTSAVVVEDPDSFSPEAEDIEMMIDDMADLVPAIRKMPVKRFYYSVRPLIEEESEDARSASRSFRILSEEGLNDTLLSVVGGKFTTGRLVGEEVAQRVMRHFGTVSDLKDPDLEETVQAFEKRYSSDPIIARSIGRRGTIDEEYAGIAEAYAISSIIGGGK
ncbi:FAD-dependent oxidoreductase [Thermoplasma sp.]|uniref:FAD-dependent oxidoreductase n=1 Tax=Thermoplasma sp. TaxID=1973142 RepID=UPI0025D38EE0|nr:glycerol-3-phosphate dehydrogenase/oxidase [Thermoplasma sp.]